MTRARLIAAALRNPNGCTAADVKHIRRTFNKKKSAMTSNDYLSCIYFPSMVGRMAYEGNAFLDMMPKSTSVGEQLSEGHRYPIITVTQEDLAARGLPPDYLDSFDD